MRALFLTRRRCGRASEVADYTGEELKEALRAIDSVIHKCEKAQEKFPEGNAHHTLLKNRLKAMYIAKALIEEALRGSQADGVN